MVKKHKYLVLLLTCGAAYSLLITLIVLFELNNENASIKNIGDAVWYSIVTFASVGYGDKFPVTWGGKLIGGMFVFGSILILSTVISQVTNSVQDRKERKKMGQFGTDFAHHVVIIGWNSFAKNICEVLIHAGRKVAIVTNEKNHIDIIYEEFPNDKVFVLFAGLDNIQILQKVNIEKSNMVFLNLPNDTDKLVAMLNIKREYPKTDFMVSLGESKLKDTFKSAGVTYVVSVEDIASKLLASYIFEPEVANFNADLISHATSNEDFDIQQFYVNEKNPYLNKKYGEVFCDIRQKHRSLLIGISKVNHNHSILKLPPDDTLIELGDYLIFINNYDASISLTELFGEKEGKKCKEKE